MVISDKLLIYLVWMYVRLKIITILHNFTERRLRDNEGLCSKQWGNLLLSRQSMLKDVPWNLTIYIIILH